MIDVPLLLEKLNIDAEKKADEWWACCPNHDEKTGSWSIKDDPGAEGHASHFCFGCGFGGGPYDLVMKVYGFAAFASAKDWVARHGIDLEESVPLDARVRVKRSRRRKGFTLPKGVVGLGTPKTWVTPVKRYRKERGITSRQVRRWGIGYALHGWLAGRIVFPIRDAGGKLASYSARSFDGRKPKYKTPDVKPSKRQRESDVPFYKPDLNIPFGAQHWDGRDTIVVTEGVINALACERAGATNIAALDGSHIQRGQIMRIGTFNEVILASDPDTAGDKLAEELSILRRWCRFRRAMLPEGQDAATMRRDELTEALFD